MQISVLGTTLNIQTDESPEYMDRVLAYLDRRITEIERSLPVRDPLRISILVNILLIDDLFKAGKGISISDEEAALMTSKIIDRIDRALQDPE